MGENVYTQEVQLIFRCSVCSEAKFSLENLEVHLWACHLRSFPYRCARCGYPALNSNALIAHFSECHDASSQQVEFKRRIDQELRLRELISRSLVVPAVEEHVYCEDDLLIEENREKFIEESSPGRERQLHRAVQRGDVIDGIEHSYESVEMVDFHENVAQEEVVEEVIDGNGAPVATTSFNIYEDGGSFMSLDDDEPSIQYVDEEGNAIDSEEVLTDSDQEIISRQLLSQVEHKRRNECSPREIKSKPRRRPPTIHQCEDCGKVLKYPSKIAEHRRSHTGERPHVCPQCGTSFSQKGALKCHIRLHTGEKPYPCTWECGRSFVSSSARQMHEKVHTGEKPFSCAYCGQLFGKKFHMRRHVSTQHSLASTKSPTGLDAAGEDAGVLVGPVTSVIEDVRRAKMTKKRPSYPAQNGSSFYEDRSLLTSVRVDGEGNDSDVK
uniref:C2H2-type domain-containing protein n=2 Tax=Parascaris univalens TaxID=6257 RepID=A0A915C9Z9_PARUN